MAGSLYVVATPIGNREDITSRALRVLNDVDCIAAEDTRTTQNLLRMYNISNKLVSNHKFNEQRNKQYLLSLLFEGKDIAIVSDAGTPCISDPGYVLIRAAINNSIPVIGVCGANAVITALSISGFSSNMFSFFGFLPRKDGEIKDVFVRASNHDIKVCVFYESPKRIKKTLGLLEQVTPDADVCLCNDLTKLYERIYYGNPRNVLEQLNTNPDSERGEYTIVVNFPKTVVNTAFVNNGDTNEGRLINYMVSNNVSAKEAISALAGDGVSRKELYAASLHLKAMFSSER